MLSIEGLEKRVLFLTGPDVTDTFTVTNTNDSGAGSLRAAITAANANAADHGNSINFAIGSGAKTIQVSSQLPAITHAFTSLNGASQPGWTDVPIILLSSLNAGPGASGLEIISFGCRIDALIIDGFDGDGILLDSENASENSVTNCWIGTNTAGNAGVGVGGNCIEIAGGATRNTIGGTFAIERNVLSGGPNSQGDGVFIQNPGTDNNIVIGNYIGTNAAGTALLSNGAYGVGIVDGASNNRIGGASAAQRNIISGNVQGGIAIAQAGTTGNIIQGNYIGTNALGTAAIHNTVGVVFADGASGNTLGGFTAGARNIISGNDDDGVLISDAGTSGNAVTGNYIGTNAAGTAAIPNNIGVRIRLGASGNGIGNYRPGRGNLISGNASTGVLIQDNGTSANVIRGNLIGCDKTGKQRLANDLAGIGITDSDNNVLGGKPKGSGNFIVFNRHVGIGVAGDASGNNIQRNAIYANGELGIDLGNVSGVNLNDKLDGDSGPNGLQNFPILTSAVSASGTTTIVGKLNSAARKTFTVEFYSSPSADPSGFGEGRFFIGAADVITNKNGNADINVQLRYSLPAGYVVTATARDGAGNTSEFSPFAGAGIISGLVFKDANGDGLSTGDQPLRGARVFLDDNDNGLFDSGEKFVTSNSKGAYTIAVGPDIYNVRQRPASGYTLTAGSAGFVVDLAIGEIEKHNFGNEPD